MKTKILLLMAKETFTQALASSEVEKNIAMHWNVNNVSLLTLRRPLRHSWRIGVFYGSHDSGMIAIPKRSKNIPHKSTITDFLGYFIFWQSACETYKERLKILDSDFTNYGVYSSGVFLAFFSIDLCSITLNKFINLLGPQ